jgi:hypothetical protein
LFILVEAVLLLLLCEIELLTERDDGGIGVFCANT